MHGNKMSNLRYFMNSMSELFSPDKRCSVDRFSSSFQKSLKKVSSFEFWKSNSITTSIVKNRIVIQSRYNTASDKNFGYYQHVLVVQFFSYSSFKN